MTYKTHFGDEKCIRRNSTIYILYFFFICFTFNRGVELGIHNIYSKTTLCQTVFENEQRLRYVRSHDVVFPGVPGV
jgi:hypothetical protein